MKSLDGTRGVMVVHILNDSRWLCAFCAKTLLIILVFGHLMNLIQWLGAIDLKDDTNIENGNNILIDNTFD